LAFASPPTQLKTDSIRFDNRLGNVTSEAYKYEQAKMRARREEEDGKVNPIFIAFKNYRQRMFVIHDKKGKTLRNQFKELVDLIDPCLETFKFPRFMTSHIGERYFHYDRGSQGCCKYPHTFNRKAFLTMLIIALSEKEPTTSQFEKVKMEMGRLSFVGDSATI
jgi:hypothetical protein